MRAHKSTTPKTDEKHRAFDNHHASCPKREGPFVEIFTLTCSKCEHQFRMGISEYAFSRDANEYLLMCGCKKPFLWFTAVDRNKG